MNARINDDDLGNWTLIQGTLSKLEGKEQEKKALLQRQRDQLNALQEKILGVMVIHHKANALFAKLEQNASGTDRLLTGSDALIHQLELRVSEAHALDPHVSKDKGVVPVAPPLAPSFVAVKHPSAKKGEPGKVTSDRGALLSEIQAGKKLHSQEARDKGRKVRSAKRSRLEIESEALANAIQRAARELDKLVAQVLAFDPELNFEMGEMLAQSQVELLRKEQEQNRKLSALEAQYPVPKMEAQQETVSQDVPVAPPLAPPLAPVPPLDIPARSAGSGTSLDALAQRIKQGLEKLEGKPSSTPSSKSASVPSSADTHLVDELARMRKEIEEDDEEEELFMEEDMDAHEEEARVLREKERIQREAIAQAKRAQEKVALEVLKEAAKVAPKRESALTKLSKRKDVQQQKLDEHVQKITVLEAALQAMPKTRPLAPLMQAPLSRIESKITNVLDISAKKPIEKSGGSGEAVEPQEGAKRGEEALSSEQDAPASSRPPSILSSQSTEKALSRNDSEIGDIFNLLGSNEREINVNLHTLYSSEKKTRFFQGWGWGGTRDAQILALSKKISSLRKDKTKTGLEKATALYAVFDEMEKKINEEKRVTATPSRLARVCEGLKKPLEKFVVPKEESPRARKRT